MVADGRDTNDLLARLARVGIDEIAYRKGHRYLCVLWNPSRTNLRVRYGF